MLSGADEQAEVNSPEREIIVYGHPTLRLKSEPVAEFDGDVRDLVRALFATMYKAPGIGLAAPQINVGRRVLVVDPSRSDERAHPLALINPRILEYAGYADLEEGCLSLPGIYADVRRPERILVRYHNEDGQQREEEYGGMMARVIQHENDHLEGKLFVDHLSRMRLTLLRKRLRDIEYKGD